MVEREFLPLKVEAKRDGGHLESSISSGGPLALNDAELANEDQHSCGYS